MHIQKKIFYPLLAVIVLASGFLLWYVARSHWFQEAPQSGRQDAAIREDDGQTVDTGGFGASVVYSPATMAIAPSIAADFDIASIENIEAMETAYGFSFTPAERAALASRKFVVRRLLDTSIRPSAGRDNVREFVQLYDEVKGPSDPKLRGAEHAVFWSSDVFFNAYNNLFTELLKEMENDVFYPAVRDLTETFYLDAAAKASAAATDEERRTWSKVRDYFAVPHAVFSTARDPLTSDDYFKDGEMRDPADVMAAYAAEDAAVDTYGNAAAVIEGLGLPSESEAAVLADLQLIYDAKDKGVPNVFKDEYDAYRDAERITFKVDFTQFTPRGTYTSSSLRRQYFRGVKWYIMVPFFLKSPDLTTYAFAAAQLMAEHPQALKDYDRLESAIGFMVGKSDDLMPADYLQAVAAGKDAADPSVAAMEYLEAARDPMIKDLAAIYPDVGVQQSDDVRLKTKGMRFFSGKFIIDSYWTGYLTQGDEAPRPGYEQKLPPMASALEVMTLLGSEYARTQIPKLDFYHAGTSKAIDRAMGELEARNAELTDADWRQNLYTAWLWTIKGLFGWQDAHKDALPAFMRSRAWEAKTLQTAAAWWTELRHATILYAKQSFAELGAGGPECDENEVPPPPKAYIEPQAEAYARLRYLAERTAQGLTDQGYELRNMVPLRSFIGLLDTVQAYVAKELSDAELYETLAVEDVADASHADGTCSRHVVTESDWETLRIGITDGLKASIPVPVEGPVLPAKDRRVALVADVHTGGDSDYTTRILYEGTGVPYVVFTAVKDVNGPRLTVGFISSHYEFTEPYGGKRLTDEQWQERFYVGDEPYSAFEYIDAASWPVPDAWYKPLFE